MIISKIFKNFKNNTLYFKIEQQLFIKSFFTSPHNSILVRIYKLFYSDTNLIYVDKISRKCLDNVISYL
jgi:hypothetical protein